MVSSPRSDQGPGLEQRPHPRHPVPEPVPGLDGPQTGAGAGAGPEPDEGGFGTRYRARGPGRSCPSECEGHARWVGRWEQRPLGVRSTEGVMWVQPGLLLRLLLDRSSLPNRPSIFDENPSSSFHVVQLTENKIYTQKFNLHRLSISIYTSIIQINEVLYLKFRNV